MEVSATSTKDNALVAHGVGIGIPIPLGEAL